MMHPHDVLQSRLIDLAGGLLSAAETREMTEHIRACGDCEKRLRMIVADRETVRTKPAPSFVDGRFRLAGFPRARHRVWIAAAASVAVLVAASIVFFAHDDRALEYWIPIGEGEATLLRSQKGVAAPGIDDALRSYRERDAAAAVEDLQQLNFPPGDVTTAALRDLYLASALVNAGRAEEALEIIPRLRKESLPTQWYYQAQWVEYVALRQTGQSAEARRCLEVLSEEPGEIGQRARTELDRYR